MKKLREGVRRRFRELRQFARIGKVLRTHKDRETLERRLVECLEEVPRRKVD